jgi:TfoX/Sxy family transcriptional regulator of competence genes
MPSSEELFDEIANQFVVRPGVARAPMFGMPTLKVNGKAFAGLSEGEMTFKLDSQARQAALAIEGARFFDPMGMGRPMKEWVQVPAAQSSKWLELAGQAYSYVATLKGKSS